MRLQLTHDARRYLVLKLEHILQFAIEPVSPDVSPGCAVDQLARYTHSSSRFAHAAFEHITNAKLSTHLLDVNGLSLVRKTRIASDNEKRLEARQRGDDVLYD